MLALLHPASLPLRSNGICTLGAAELGSLDARHPRPHPCCPVPPCSNGIYALGVADGVYMWREKGIDAGLFSRVRARDVAAVAASPEPSGGSGSGGITGSEQPAAAGVAGQVGRERGALTPGGPRW